MSKSSPPAPDYTGAAQAQGQASQNVTEMQTVANRPDINTPWGQETWSATPVMDPTTGQMVNTWQANINLTPAQQQALNSQQQIQANQSGLAQKVQGNAAQVLGTPMNWGSFSPLANAPDAAKYGSLPTAPSYSPQSIQGSVAGGGPIQNSISTQGVNPLGTGQQYSDQGAKAAFGQYQFLNQPLQQQATSSLDTQLRNQGLNPGDQAYDTAMGNLQRQQTAANQNAEYGAVLTGANLGNQQFQQNLAANQNQFGQNEAQGAFANQAAGQQFQQNVSQGAFANQAAQQALAQQLAIGGQQFGQQLQSSQLADTRANQNYQQNLQSAAYQDALRQQQISEAEQQRGYSLNEMNAILNGQQVGMPSFPGFSNAGVSQTTPYLSAAQSQGQSMLDQFNAQQQQQAGLYSGIGTAALAAAMFFSDRRLKKDVIPLYLDESGVRWYRYRYVWEHGGPGHIGVMADEVPWAAVLHPSGYLMVDYGRI